METYKLLNKIAPWGDYGDILLCGMTAHEERLEGKLQIERTGPYVPPMIKSGIGDIIVTDSIKRVLEISGLSGIGFMPVIKKRIVYINWTTWDLVADEPLYYPETGEPEDYILGSPNSEELSEKMGELWELVVQKSGSFDNHDRYIPENNGADIFMAVNKGYVLVSKKAKQWIEKNAGDWVYFEAL